MYLLGAATGGLHARRKVGYANVSRSRVSDFADGPLSCWMLNIAVPNRPTTTHTPCHSWASITLFTSNQGVTGPPHRRVAPKPLDHLLRTSQHERLIFKFNLNSAIPFTSTNTIFVPLASATVKAVSKARGSFFSHPNQRGQSVGKKRGPAIMQRRTCCTIGRRAKGGSPLTSGRASSDELSDISSE